MAQVWKPFVSKLERENNANQRSIECFRGWQRGVRNFTYFGGSPCPSLTQQNEPFLLQNLHPCEGNPLDDQKQNEN